MPGSIDTHMHLTMDASDLTEQTLQSSAAKALKGLNLAQEYMSYSFTALRGLGRRGGPGEDRDARGRIERPWARWKVRRRHQGNASRQQTEIRRDGAPKGPTDGSLQRLVDTQNQRTIRDECFYQQPQKHATRFSAGPSGTTGNPMVAVEGAFALQAHFARKVPATVLLPGARIVPARVARGRVARRVLRIVARRGPKFVSSLLVGYALDTSFWQIAVTSVPYLFAREWLKFSSRHLGE
jgi:hypothetical protein